MDLTRLLVQYGADSNARDDEGRTPSMMATEEKYLKIIQILLKCGAEDHRV